MSDPWVNQSGQVVHPDAPTGGGGPGYFKDPIPHGSALDALSPVPHPHSPAGRYLALNDKQKSHLKKKPSSSRRKTKSDDGALNKQIKAGADALVGAPVVGSGECYDLADKILKEAAAKSAPQFGKVTPTADYKWGVLIEDHKHIKPGDILQFRNYLLEIRSETKRKKTLADHSTRTEKETNIEEHTREHHTAVVSSTEGHGTLTVVEQNVPDPKTEQLSTVVMQNRLYLFSRTIKVPQKVTTGAGGIQIEEESTVTITVKGTIKAYRPQRIGHD
jgi:hypothetical protein